MNSKGANGAAEKAVQIVEGMARTPRLDLLSRTNTAVGSDLPITSWMVRHAAWLLSHFQTGSADGMTAYARQFERPYESPVLPFAERVMWKDPTLQFAKLKSSWGFGLWLGTSQTSNAHLIGTRVGIVVARTIRRLPASEREDSNLVVAMRGTPVAGRPADAAAGDAPSNPVANLPKPTVAGAQPSSSAVENSHYPSGEIVESSGSGVDVPVEMVQAVVPTTKSHAAVEEFDDSLVPKRQRGRPATHCWPSPGSPEYTVRCPGCDGRSCRHLLTCQQTRLELGFSASSSLRDVRGDVVMEKAPPPSPPAERPPVLRTSDETDAMTLAAVHRYGHEEPQGINRTKFESFVRDGLYLRKTR